MGRERTQSGGSKEWEEWRRHECLKCKNGDETVEVELHLEVLNESGLRRRKRDVFPDEREEDREKNCQGKPVNPGRQSGSVYAFRCCPACTKRLKLKYPVRDVTKSGSEGWKWGVKRGAK